MTIYSTMNDSSQRPSEHEIVPALLDAVERLCADTSPENVGMRDIAESAGPSLGVAYRYFDPKDALFGAALEHVGPWFDVAWKSNTSLTVTRGRLSR